MKNAIILLSILLASVASADTTPVKLSSVGRSMFYRGGRCYVGDAGFNGGDWSRHVFNGTFDDYRYQNTAGAEIVIPTTGLDDDSNDTGVPWFVTQFLVGHAGNTKYSLYYTTEPAPDYSHLQLKEDNDSFYYEVASDSRTWTPVDGATGVQAAGTKTYNPNVVATAVKYVFDTRLDWTPSLAEVEVWGYEPDDDACQHPSYTDWEEVSGSATCTAFGVKRRKCMVCGEVFEQDDAPPLGHDWETHLDTPGTSSSYGSGTLVCSRCGESIVFNVPLDLTTLGGVAIPGKVQFTDLSVSASHPDGGGAGPEDMIDGDWTYDWGAYWFPGTRNESEYVQYDFATEIDLTKIEWSAANHAQTLKFYTWDGENEEPLAEIPVTAVGSAGYQRGSMEFRGVSAKGIRLHIADSIGIQYGGGRFVSLSELHPWGTVKGAGKLDVLRTRILLY